MSDSTLYDDDIVLWSEQQAAAIRRLRETARGLPNELDIENVAEEIESVGRSELAAVESYVELILVHLVIYNQDNRDVVAANRTYFGVLRVAREGHSEESRPSMERILSDPEIEKSGTVKVPPSEYSGRSTAKCRT